MKNSLYVNNVNVGLSEMARLEFMETIPNENINLVETVHVVTLSMHVEFLRNLHLIIGQTLDRHDENIANLSKNKDVN